MAPSIEVSEQQEKRRVDHESQKAYKRAYSAVLKSAPDGQPGKDVVASESQDLGGISINTTKTDNAEEDLRRLRPLINSNHPTGCQGQDIPWKPEPVGAHNDLWPPQHPKRHWARNIPGQTHRESFNLDLDNLHFGKLVHIDWVENEHWTDRPAIVTGINVAARRVRVFPLYSFTKAGGLDKRFSNAGRVYNKNDQALRMHDMMSHVLIASHASGATEGHLGTPVVRLSGDQLGKNSWVNTGTVRELSLDRVSKHSRGGVFMEAFLPLGQMKILKKHVHYMKNNLFPSVENGLLEHYDEPWEGFQEYW